MLGAFAGYIPRTQSVGQRAGRGAPGGGRNAGLPERRFQRFQRRVVFQLGHFAGQQQGVAVLFRGGSDQRLGAGDHFFNHLGGQPGFPNIGAGSQHVLAHGVMLNFKGFADAVECGLVDQLHTAGVPTDHVVRGAPHHNNPGAGGVAFQLSQVRNFTNRLGLRRETKLIQFLSKW